MIPDGVFAEAPLVLPRKEGGRLGRINGLVRATVCVDCGRVESYMDEQDRLRMWEGLQKRKA